MNVIPSPGKQWGLRRLSNAHGVFTMLAVDQRPPITKPIARHHQVDQAPWPEVATFKQLLVSSLQQHASAVLLDPHYAVPLSLDQLSPAKGLIVTLEDSNFHITEAGRLSKIIDNWSVAKIKRMGGDAVKVLIWYHPEAGIGVRTAQQDLVKQIGEDCAKYDITFLLELLLYPLNETKGDADSYNVLSEKKSDLVLKSLDCFAAPEYAVDVFKLECPVATDAIADATTAQPIFNELGRIAGRPWVMLSAGSDRDTFRQVLTRAFMAGASGFLAGRTIWQAAFHHYPNWQAITNDLQADSATYLREIAELAEQNAADWSRHQCYGQAGAGFAYQEANFKQQYGGI